VTNPGHYFGVSLKRLKKTTKNLSKIVDVPTEIRTEYLLNTSPNIHSWLVTN
jgi:hypothetical protein